MHRGVEDIGAQTNVTITWGGDSSNRLHNIATNGASVGWLAELHLKPITFDDIAQTGGIIALRQTGEIQTERTWHILKLLDVITVTVRSLVLSDPTPATLLATCPWVTSDAHRVYRRRRGVWSMNRFHMALEIVLATERPAARFFITNKGFQPVGVVSGDVRLQVIAPGERSRT